MLKRLPLFPTLLVLVAVAVMVRLGFWQLDRADQKAALLARYQSSQSLERIVFPTGSGDQAVLFRLADLQCDRPGTPTLEGAGQAGTRYIVECKSGALVQIGTSVNPAVRPSWEGGMITGIVSAAPDHRSWVAAIVDPKPIKLMLVADPPLAGLAANARPDPNNIPNNHWSYAIQWFLFALTALVIYGLAVRKRLKQD